jgi:hypothetical protein
MIIIRVSGLFKSLQKKLKPGAVQMITCSLAAALLAHYVSCAFCAIAHARSESSGVDTWLDLAHIENATK